MAEEPRQQPQDPQNKNTEFAKQAGEKTGAAVEKSVTFVFRVIERIKPFLKSAAKVVKNTLLTLLEWLKKGTRFTLTGFGRIFSHAKAVNWGEKAKAVKQKTQALASGPAGANVKGFFSSLPARLKNLAQRVMAFVARLTEKLQNFLFNIFQPRLSQTASRGLSFGIVATSLALCLILIVSLIAGVFRKFSGSGGLAAAQGGAMPGVGASPVTETQPSVDPSQQKWLVMLYADADDEILEKDILFDLNEMETVGSSERVQIVAQIDRFKGGYEGDGDWTGTRRYFVTRDDDLNTLNSELVADLGELDMGSPETLVDFVTWAAKTYPADRYVLILSDHGAGWPGGWSDSDPENLIDGNWIYLHEIGEALKSSLSQSTIGKFELVGLDACLMSMLEVYNEIAPYANYAVASQELEPALGWAYGYFLEQLSARPEMSGADLAREIVASYINKDLRILNDDARNDMLLSYGMSKSMSAEELVHKWSTDITLSAVDLSELGDLNDAVNHMVVALKDMDQAKVAEARSYAQPFENAFDEDLPSPYIDLWHFASLLAENSGTLDLNPILENLKNAMAKALVAERHGQGRSGASGFSIHFPVSDLYWGEYINFEYYTYVSQRFVENSLWDDFLAYHYAGKEFDSGQPDRGARVPAPGFSVVSITPPVVTPDLLSVTSPRINIKSQVQGDRVAYIYVITLRKVEDRFLFYQFHYFLSSASKELNGVEYPLWERQDGVIPINLDYEIGSTAIGDGKTVAFAVLEPEAYGTKSQEMISVVKGFYINSKTGSRISARMYFYNREDNNKMRNIVGFTGSEERGITFMEILPKKGDQFQFLDTWWVMNEQGQPEDVLYEGNTLTFGDQPFEHGWSQKGVVPGEYYIGIMVEDMDGFQNYSLTPILLQ